MSETNKYSNSKIYKIWSPSHDDLVYYGSTYQSLSQRMATHKNDYRRWKAGKFCKVTSFKIFEECDDYRIDLVENYPCSNKEELNSKEGEYIKNNMCVNKRVAGRTDKQYYQDNRDKIKDQVNQYYQDHKEEVKERVKERYEEHKDRINEKRREKYAQKKQNPLPVN